MFAGLFQSTDAQNEKKYCDRICEYVPNSTFSQSLTRYYSFIIESVDSISRDERDVPLTQYITNA